MSEFFFESDDPATVRMVAHEVCKFTERRPLRRQVELWRSSDEPDEMDIDICRALAEFAYPRQHDIAVRLNPLDSPRLLGAHIDIEGGQVFVQRRRPLGLGYDTLYPIQVRDNRQGEAL